MDSNARRCTFKTFCENKNNFDQWFGPNPVNVATLSTTQGSVCWRVTTTCWQLPY